MRFLVRTLVTAVLVSVVAWLIGLAVPDRKRS